MELGAGWEPRPRPSSRRLTVLISLLIVVALGAAAWLLWDRSHGPAPFGPQDLFRPPHRLATAGPTPTSAPTATPFVPPTPAPEPETDAAVREIVATLSGSPELAKWLATEGLARTFVTAVLQISEGKAPRKLLLAMAPEGDFQVVEKDGKLVLDPASYHRYDAATAVVSAADPAAVADAYRRLEPRFDAEWHALGEHEKSFRDALSDAIRVVLKTPEVEREVELLPKLKSYKMADPSLEGHSAAEKQLMRLGPENLRAVKKALRDLASRLGLAVAVL